MANISNSKQNKSIIKKIQPKAPHELDKRLVQKAGNQLNLNNTFKNDDDDSATDGKIRNNIKFEELPPISDIKGK